MPKILKKPRVFKVFVNEGFWYSEASHGSFGLLLALLGRFDPKLGLKTSGTIFQTGGKKNVLKMLKKNVQILVEK